MLKSWVPGCLLALPSTLGSGPRICDTTGVLAGTRAVPGNSALTRHAQRAQPSVGAAKKKMSRRFPYYWSTCPRRWPLASRTPSSRPGCSFFVFVRELGRATEFYRDTPGLPLQFSSSEHGYASFSAGSVRLGVALPRPDHAHLVGRHTGVDLEVSNLEAEYTRRSGLRVRFTMPPTRQSWVDSWP